MKVQRLLAAALVLLLLPVPPVRAAAEAGQDVVISEVMAANGTWSDAEHYDWVELHNTGSSTVDLSGWGLSDSAKKPYKWTFPEGTKLKKDAYLYVWCTGEDGIAPGKKSPYSATFSLSKKGDDVYLTRADGTAADSVKFGPQYANVSWGRAAGSGETGYLESATPGKKNVSAVYPALSAAPILTVPGGFYTGSVTVTLSAPAGSVVRYTTDGNTPTAKSKVFPTGGLTLKNTSALRVRAFADGLLPSETLSATYFVDDPFPVAVVSLTTDPDYMFSSKSGALVKGKGAVPNYDKPYEYPVNIEYFDESGACVINQVGSFTASGHSARQNAQKSIALHARSVFGEEYFEFNPFPNRNYTHYKALLLRSTNSDAYSERLRDVVFSSLADTLDLCYQDARPIVVYINGEYWGHYNLREKINKHMVAQWEGISLDDEETVDAIDLLQRTGSDAYVSNGSNKDWVALCSFCKTKDLNDPDNLQYVLDRLDVDNLFTHAAYEIISGNSDITNVRVYRVPGGKWKYLLFDVEASFGSGSDSKTIPLEYYIKPVSDKINGFRHEPLNALLAVPAYRERFLRRFAEVLEQAFLWPKVESRFDYWEGILEQLLPRQNKRWPYLTMKRWRTNVNATRYYARVRPKKIVSMLKKRMKLTDEEVTLYFGEIQKKLDVQNTLQ